MCSVFILGASRLSSAKRHQSLVAGSSVVPAGMSTGVGKRTRPVAPSAPPAPIGDGLEPTTVANRGCCGKSSNGGSGRGCCNRCLEKCVVCTATLTRVCLIIPNLVFLVSQRNNHSRKFPVILGNCRSVIFLGLCGRVIYIICSPSNIHSNWS